MNQNETAPKTEVDEVAQVLRKNLLIFGSEMWYVFDFSSHCYNHRSKWIETVRTTASSCACLIDLNTEFEREQLISIRLRNRITVVRVPSRVHHLSLLNARTKRSCSQFRGCRRNSKNNSQTTGKRFNSFYIASDLYQNICSFWKRATTSAGKPESTWRGIAKKCRPSFFLGSLFGTCLDCFLIFVLNRYECVSFY